MTTVYARHMHQGATFDSVRVEEAMHHGVLTCRPEASLVAVARLMAAHRIHAVVVTHGTRPMDWGVASDLDLVGAASEGSLAGRTASEIAMTSSVFVTSDDTIARAAQLMRQYTTHHLIVLGRGSDRPVGIISTLDIADVVAELPGRNGVEAG